MTLCEKCLHAEVCAIRDGHDEGDERALTYCAAFRGWISVDERLPDRNRRYLTHCKIDGQSLVCIPYYCKVGGFNEETVTHWMHLPEPPKGE